MIKKLTDKQLVDYVPYRGVSLSKSGLKKAVELLKTSSLGRIFSH